jgi:hypothetical protein
MVLQFQFWLESALKDVYFKAWAQLKKRSHKVEDVLLLPHGYHVSVAQQVGWCIRHAASYASALVAPVNNWQLCMCCVFRTSGCTSHACTACSACTMTSASGAPGLFNTSCCGRRTCTACYLNPQPQFTCALLLLLLLLWSAG